MTLLQCKDTLYFLFCKFFFKKEKKFTKNLLCLWPQAEQIFASGGKFLREPPGGPRSGGEAMSEAKPVRWRPVAKRRGTPKY
jgi:hypothetical protein